MSMTYRSRGIKVIVLDPLADEGWHADFCTDDPNVFLSIYWDSRRCAVFIDEAGDVAGHYDNAMIMTAKRGRHWGHINHYLTQRGAEISPTIRNNCGRLFLFTTHGEDCKIHAREWNNPTLLQGPTLPQGDYFTTSRFGDVQRGSAFR